MAKILLVALCACLLFALAAGDGTYPQGQGECVPGTRWKEDCNWCQCAADGKSKACTLVLCSGRPPSKPMHKPSEHGTLVAGPCTAGEVVRVDCNTCRCAGDGSGYACTRQACPRTRRATPYQDCTPGESRTVGCNTCVCLPTGVEACTDEVCLPAERAKRGTSCTPGTTRQVDCNTCTCLDNGQEACTERGCLSQTRTKREASCTPGTTRTVRCNTCRCLPSGVEACTKRECLPDERKKRSASPQRGQRCRPGESFKVDCNTCTCPANGDRRSAACTLKACLPGGKK